MKWVSVLSLFALVFCAQAYNDVKCTDRGGSCQRSSSSCVGGTYFSNMCGGPSHRRCCVPMGPSGCMKKTEQLACLLYDSNKVRAATSHPSGQRDKAYAKNNLQDMCQGRKASRSSYRCNAQCNAPGGTTCLSYNLLNYLVKLTDGRGIVQINELAGACHSCQSKHYSGLAVDLHKNGRQRDYIDMCRANEGWALSERNHIHCQFTDGRHPNWM